jgi:hypothetical protein
MVAHFPHIWKLNLKDKCIHKYIYDLMHTHIYKKTEREVENMIVIVYLSEGKGGREKKEREIYQYT